MTVMVPVVSASGVQSMVTFPDPLVVGDDRFPFRLPFELPGTGSAAQPTEGL